MTCDGGGKTYEDIMSEIVPEGARTVTKRACEYAWRIPVRVKVQEHILSMIMQDPISRLAHLLLHL